ncbi:Serine/threonine-protein kinase env7 [Microbotryomycetes sp. JL221]|nr:Serine/threonine-protein kinase env7 [Microbotryomycetes sp. JL221]
MQVLFEHARDALLALTGSCCQTDATLKLNGRSFKIVKLLGEGGFSYVYLAQDQSSGRQFALKKIRCPLGSDSVKQALKEVEAYKRFKHPNIIRCLDSCVVQDKDDQGGKVIYLFLPFYKNGTVQHTISANAVNGSRYAERDMLSIFLGTCQAVRAMHEYHAGPSAATSSLSRSSRYPPPSSSSTMTLRDDERQRYEEEEDEDRIITRGDNEDEALIGGLETTRQQLVEQDQEQDSHESENDGDGIVLSKLDQESIDKNDSTSTTQSVQRKQQPWAHRDIKPANIMISDDGTTPILMDFGSALPARIPIPNRSVALFQQDLAAEHCSMPFRAPELFDVKTGTELTESVDIWSLGATLYAMAYGTSPFETVQQSEHGGSIAMAVMSGRYKFPQDDTTYSQGFKHLIEMMLKVEPSDRPDIDQVIAATEKVLARLQ